MALWLMAGKALRALHTPLRTQEAMQGSQILYHSAITITLMPLTIKYILHSKATEIVRSSIHHRDFLPPIGRGIQPGVARPLCKAWTPYILPTIFVFSIRLMFIGISLVHTRVWKTSQMPMTQLMRHSRFM